MSVSGRVPRKRECLWPQGGECPELPAGHWYLRSGRAGGLGASRTAVIYIFWNIR